MQKNGISHEKLKTFEKLSLENRIQIWISIEIMENIHLNWNNSVKLTKMK